MRFLIWFALTGCVAADPGTSGGVICVPDARFCADSATVAQCTHNGTDFVTKGTCDGKTHCVETCATPGGTQVPCCVP